MSTSEASTEPAPRSVPARMDDLRTVANYLVSIEKEIIYMQQQLEVVYRARDQFADEIRQGLNRQQMALLRLKCYWRSFLLGNGLTEADMRQQGTGFPDSSDEEDSSSAGYTSQQSESDV